MGYGSVVHSTTDKLSGTAVPSEVLEGETFCSDSGVDLVGTMINNGLTNIRLDNDRHIARLDGYYKEGSSVFIDYEDTKQVRLSTTEQYIEAENGKVLNKVYVPAVKGDALPENVLNTKVFSSASGVDIKGTMTNNGAFISSVNTKKLTVNIPEGYHDGNGTVSAYAEEAVVTLTGEEQIITGSNSNFLSKVTVPGVQGNATNEFVLSGRTFSSATAGMNQIGTMINHGNETLDIIDQSVTEDYIIANIPNNGYYNTNSKLRLQKDENLIATNIRKGTTIYGIEGSVQEYLGFDVTVLMKGTTRIDYGAGYKETSVTWTADRNYDKVVIFWGSNGIIYANSLAYINNTQVGTASCGIYSGPITKGSVVKITFTRGHAIDSGVESFCAGAYQIIAIEPITE